MVSSRDLQHDRFYAKKSEISHRIAYATRRMSYIYCILIYTRCRMAWVYYHILCRGMSHIVAYYLENQQAGRLDFLRNNLAKEIQKLRILHVF
jgi:hypothetical protein